ncbi:nuclear transport factor 2 family protein [Kytococcus sedentarius]|uniref:nuclear transport factor 2 family protein n=1 Tax=Kytococcus sedentarius TaxID=1276 RepID=UPI0035BBFFAA
MDSTDSATAPGSGPHEAAVRAYYVAVDADDVDTLIGLFTPDATYERPGYEPFVGHDALRAFYTGDRVIASGEHVLDMVVADEEGGQVAVHGRFEGTLKDGSAASVRFADFYLLDAQSRFTRRTTFFHTAAV